MKSGSAIFISCFAQLVNQTETELFERTRWQFGELRTLKKIMKRLSPDARQNLANEIFVPLPLHVDRWLRDSTSFHLGSKRVLQAVIKSYHPALIWRLSLFLSERASLVWYLIFHFSFSCLNFYTSGIFECSRGMFFSFPLSLFPFWTFFLFRGDFLLLRLIFHKWSLNKFTEMYV